MVLGYQCYNPSEKVSGVNDALLPNYKGFKCVTQFVTLFHVGREKNKKQNWTKFFLH